MTNMRPSDLVHRAAAPLGDDRYTAEQKATAVTAWLFDGVGLRAAARLAASRKRSPSPHSVVAWTAEYVARCAAAGYNLAIPKGKRS